MSVKQEPFPSAFGDCRFGAYALKELEIASLGRHPNARYGLRIDKNRIEIVY